MIFKETIRRQRGRPPKADWNSLLKGWSHYRYKVEKDGTTPLLKEFCERNGISERSFRYQRQKIAKDKQAAINSHGQIEGFITAGDPEDVTTGPTEKSGNGVASKKIPEHFKEALVAAINGHGTYADPVLAVRHAVTEFCGSFLGDFESRMLYRFVFKTASTGKTVDTSQYEYDKCHRIANQAELVYRRLAKGTSN